MRRNLFELKQNWQDMGSLSEKNAHHLALYLTEIRGHCETLNDILENKIIKGTDDNNIKLLYKGLGGYNAWVSQLIYELKETKKFLGKIKTKIRKSAFNDDEVPNSIETK
jgi:hypothetical protein